MNKKRRKEIQKAAAQLEDIKSLFEDLRDEEQDYYDNMPGNLQESQKGILSSDALDSLENVITSIESAIEDAESAKNN